MGDARSPRRRRERPRETGNQSGLNEGAVVIGGVEDNGFSASFSVLIIFVNLLREIYTYIVHPTNRTSQLSIFNPAISRAILV